MEELNGQESHGEYRYNRGQKMNPKSIPLLLLPMAFILLLAACGGGSQMAVPTPRSASTPTPVQGVPGTIASAITSPPPSMEGINTHTEMYGTGADPNIITLGPKHGGHPGWKPYPNKTSMEFELDHGAPVLAPIDMVFIGFKNRNAKYRIKPYGQGKVYIAPFNDLLLCFESSDPDWPGMIICTYHLFTSPLLLGHNQSPDCAEVEKWGSTQQMQGHIFYGDSDLMVPEMGEAVWKRLEAVKRLVDARSCEALIGHSIKRGEVIGFAGSVGDRPLEKRAEGEYITVGTPHSMAPFRFKVFHPSENLTVKKGNRYLHWVQPGSFFYWKCYSPGTNFPRGVLAYPFECGGYQLPVEQHDVGFKYSSKRATTTLTPVPSAATPSEQQSPAITSLPESVFKPSLEALYEVNIEEAVVYGIGGTLDGGQVELLLDLAVPDTGTGGPRPLWVDIHGGGFVGGSRNPKRGPAARGWVAASIDYRLADDNPLPGPRFQEFYEAIGGAESSARYRSVVAAVEDTLTAIDYLVGRADELAIDTDRIVLAGFSAGAFTALNAAYCTDKFGITRSSIAAVVDYGGRLIDTCGAGSSIDPGEAAVFVVHGTEDTGETRFEGALSIIQGAQEAGIAYEFHPLDGVGHTFYPKTATIADGRTVEAATYEFLDRVLDGE